MSPLERYYKIDQLLKDRQVVSFAVFKEKLGMSRASVKRDLEYMRSRFNAPIEYDRQANGYRFGKPRSGPRYELPGLWFNAGEVQALLTTLQLLTNLQPGLLDGQVKPVLERLRSILGTGDHSWEEVVKRMRIFLPERRAGKAEHFGVVAAALLKRARVWIRHYSRKDDRETEREISPQRLVHYRDNWYLDAYCHLRQDLRSFAVDAIRQAVIQETPAKEVRDAELDDYLGSGYGIFAGRKVEWATLKFTPEAARWVSAQNWHPKQRSRVEKDGSYVLELPYAEDRELVMEILKFGADVAVLQPPALRERVATSLREAAERYAGPSE
ncbi:MAG: helix-turn-helix type 11 domain protein [Burkholderiales bacterium]|nr:helix-turn-helix type 11 domain protein [Burkholderiales bacterium]